jgi:putative DNA primase/helicase
VSAAGNPVSAFWDAMAKAGLAGAASIVADGRLHEFDVEGDRKGSRHGYYVLHLDGRPAGAFGCVKRGVRETWRFNGADLSDFDRAALDREIEAKIRRREKEEARRQGAVAEGAATLWASYRPAPADHPYLLRKKVGPHGARVDGRGQLVLATADGDGKIWSLQTIGTDGAKRFMPGGRKRGCMHLIGRLGGDRVVVAEGFATGASIHEATGVPVAVAFDAGNLEPVAAAIRRKWPAARIVVAADDDRETLVPRENPGLHFARKAAAAVDGAVAIPVFQDPTGKTDFNDLHVAEGAQAVAGIIVPAFPEPKPEPEREAGPGTEGDPKPEHWKDDLHRTDRGEARDIIHNVAIILRKDARFAGRLRWNRLLEAAEGAGLPWRKGAWQQWTDADDIQLANWCQQRPCNYPHLRGAGVGLR